MHVKYASRQMLYPVSKAFVCDVDTVERAARALRAEFVVAVRAWPVAVRATEFFMPARAVIGLDAVRDCIAVALRAATFDVVVFGRVTAVVRATVFDAVRAVEFFVRIPCDDFVAS